MKTKQIVVAFGALALAIAAATPASADFAVVKFKDGSCRAWADHMAAPLEPGYKYLWVSVPSWDVAQHKGAYAMHHRWCRHWW
jgi:hypothetical protein